MKIFISYPPLEGKGTPMLGQNRQFQWFHNPSFIYPMVTASAATLLKSQGHDVFWDDGIAKKLKPERWWENIIAEKPRLIAMETKTPVVRLHWKIADRIKKELPETVVVLMGDHVTAKPEETMRNSLCDYVITGGDFDFMLASIVRHIEDKDALKQKAGLESAPTIARHIQSKEAINGKSNKELQSAVARHPDDSEILNDQAVVRRMEDNSALEPGIWYRENGEIKNTGQFKLDHDLNTLPFIDRELTNWKLYGEPLYKREPFTYTMVGRDCPWAKCKFCSWTTLFPKFRTRTPESLLDEIGMLIEKYGVREIFDDTGTFPGGGWLERFCNGMIERGFNKKIRISCNFRFDYLTPERAKLMRKAGFRLMKLGLESANQITLDLLNKGTKVEEIESGCKIAKDAGLEVHLTVMVGYPWETRADAENTLNLAKRLMAKGYADMLQSTVTIPYPGTPLYDEAVAGDWLLIAPDDYEKFDMTAPIMKTPDMTPEEVVEICNSIYRSFLQPSYILRYLLSIRHPADVKFIAKGAKAVIGHLLDFTRARGNSPQPSLKKRGRKNPPSLI